MAQNNHKQTESTLTHLVIPEYVFLLDTQFSSIKFYHYSRKVLSDKIIMRHLSINKGWGESAFKLRVKFLNPACYVAFSVCQNAILAIKQ